MILFENINMFGRERDITGSMTAVGTVNLINLLISALGVGSSFFRLQNLLIL